MLRRIASWIFASLLACFPLSLQAVPFFVHPNHISGSAGDVVQLSLVDELTVNLEAATIEVLFDPNRLAFVSARLGSVIDDPNQCLVGLPTGFCLEVNDSDKALGKVVASLASSLLPIDGAVDLELLRISFDILPTALLGPTDVSFQCLDRSNRVPPGANFCAIDYNIPLTTGTVTVLASSTPIPLPSSAWLLALGLAAASVVRMRC